MSDNAGPDAGDSSPTPETLAVPASGAPEISAAPDAGDSLAAPNNPEAHRYRKKKRSNRRQRAKKIRRNVLIVLGLILLGVFSYSLIDLIVNSTGG